MNKRGKLTRALIREKSYTLFAQKGFKEVTMKDICHATGLSRGGLYCHYGSTSEIFQEIVDCLMERQDDEFKMKMEAGLSAVTILDDILKRYRAEMMDGDSSLSLAIYEYFSTNEKRSERNAIYDQYMFSYDMWNSLIQYGIDKNEFKPVNARAVFDLIVFAYQGVRMYSKLMSIDEEIPNNVVNEIRKILVNQGEN